MRCSRNNFASASSVSLFPRPRIRDITSDRFALVKTSGIFLNREIHEPFENHSATKEHNERKGFIPLRLDRESPTQPSPIGFPFSASDGEKVAPPDEVFPGSGEGPTGAHLMFLALVVAFAHHPDVFFGILVLFLGLVVATREYQDALKLREGLLVGFFLAGLVTLGSLQAYWLKPLIERLSGNALFSARPV